MLDIIFNILMTVILVVVLYGVMRFVSYVLYIIVSFSDARNDKKRGW